MKIKRLFKIEKLTLLPQQDNTASSCFAMNKKDIITGEKYTDFSLLEIKETWDWLCWKWQVTRLVKNKPPYNNG